MCASTRLLASLRWLCEQAAALWLEFATHPWGWAHACACFTTMATWMAASFRLFGQQWLRRQHLWRMAFGGGRALACAAPCVIGLQCDRCFSGARVCTLRGWAGRCVDGQQ